jgi:hypothetical protein
MLLLTAGRMVCLGTEIRLEGCTDPAIFTQTLARLSTSDWSQISIARMESMWPTRLAGLDCGTEGCSSLSHEGRVISGHCQCCETFYFEVRRGRNGKRHETLDAIVIDYSSADQNEVVTTAQDLARAAGMAEINVMTVGRQPSQDFSWRDPQNQHVSIVSAKIARVGSVTTLYFYFSRNKIDSTGVRRPTR